MYFAISSVHERNINTKCNCYFNSADNSGCDISNMQASH